MKRQFFHHICQIFSKVRTSHAVPHRCPSSKIYGRSFLRFNIKVRVTVPNRSAAYPQRHFRSRAGLWLTSLAHPVVCCCSSTHTSHRHSYSTNYTQEISSCLFALLRLDFVSHLRFCSLNHSEFVVPPSTSLTLKHISSATQEWSMQSA